MAYAEWIRVEIRAENATLSIKNISLDWGKLHKDGDKDTELNKEHYTRQLIRSGQSLIFNSCGKENSWTGTDGEFELYDGDQKLGKFKWDSPWGSKDNTIRWDNETETDKTYKITTDGGSKRGGPIGDVKLICTKIA